MGQMYAAYGAYTGGDEKRPACSRQAIRLEGSSTATTVRAPDGKAKVLNGPYAETKEQLGGYYLIRGGRSRQRAVLGVALPRRAIRRDRGSPRPEDVIWNLSCCEKVNPLAPRPLKQWRAEAMAS